MNDTLSPARLLQALRDARERIEQLEADRHEPIAIVGMAGRFPGAQDIDAFWSLLSEGRRGIQDLDDAALQASGEPPSRWQRPDYVRAWAGLEAPDGFDAAFFGYAPREAAVLDPQHRVFLETAWAALEDAGLDPSRLKARTGVYAGAALNAYLLRLQEDAALREGDDRIQVVVGNVLGLLPTRVSYHLDLRGPSVGVQTGCSTSLVAVHQACRALQAGECEVALAGAVTIADIDPRGYIHQPGGIASPDGHCRAFDARGAGTVFGSGVGVVVLKRLSAALADGDPIRALIKGTAVNNDGALKVGLIAPSVNGQAEVIREALGRAGARPKDIDAIEAHGTATEMGDPIEVSALHQALRGAASGRIALGTVKSNLGHLDAAAGMAGLMKMVLALEHEAIPPSIDHDTPHPGIPFPDGPLRVNTTLSAWPRRPERPRLAGVSSFGMGGTNAHVVLAEAPIAPARPPRTGGLVPRRWQVLPVSARTPSALQLQSQRLADALSAAGDRQPADALLADAALTLQCGRREMGERLAIVADGLHAAIDLCRSGVDGPQRLLASGVTPGRPVAFLFPGQGAQQRGMARALYEQEPVFRDVIDACARHLGPERPLLDWLYAEGAAPDWRDTAQVQPALLAVEVALSRLWMAWGLAPEALIGHSLGEWSAACVAGVFSLETALDLVALRGELMQSCEPGGMLAVMLDEASLRARLADWLAETAGPEGVAGIEVAAVNGPRQCVLAGPLAAIAACQSALENSGEVCHRLPTSHAFHSAAMDAVLDRFEQAVTAAPRQAPSIPLASNLTGRLLGNDEAVSPAYWRRQLRETVRFSQGIDALMASLPAGGAQAVLVEMGPGTALSQLLRQRPASQRPLTVAVMEQPRQADRGTAQALARLWTQGVTIDWVAVQQGQGARRMHLPTYPFEHQRLRVGAQPGQAVVPVSAHVATTPACQSTATAGGLAEARLHRLRWVEEGAEGALEHALSSVPASGQALAGLALVDDALGQALSDQQHPSTTFERVADLSSLTTRLRAHAQAWAEAPAHDGVAAIHLVIDASACDAAALLLALADWALLSAPSNWRAACTLLTRGGCRIAADAPADAGMSACWAALQVAGQELGWLRVRQIDMPAAMTATGDAAFLTSVRHWPQASARRQAWRAGERWTPRWHALPAPEAGAAASAMLEAGTVHAVVGDLAEGLGLLHARWLGRRGARVVLVTRAGVPQPEGWAHWLATHAPLHPISQLIQQLQGLRDSGVQLRLLSGPLDDAGWLVDALGTARAGFGALHGIFHVGAMGDEASAALASLAPADVERLLQARQREARALLDAVQALPQPPAFVVHQSSLSAVLGGAGFATYAAASAWLDAWVQAREGATSWISLDWDACHVDEGAVDGLSASRLMAQALRADEVGALVSQAITLALAQGRSATWVASRRVMDEAERQAFEPALPASAQGVAGTGTTATGTDVASPLRAGPQVLQPRPALGTAYVAPRSATERVVAQALAELLGLAEVGVHDDFFELGGQSLLAIQAVSRLRKEHGVELPMRALLFEARTAEGIARLIDTQRAATGQQAPEPTAYQAVQALADETARHALMADLLADIEQRHHP
ncbi:MAG: beta-ketoacyl synthase N-terminal-like domain-containing protein [Pseudomonadota bacterium]